MTCGPRMSVRERRKKEMGCLCWAGPVRKKCGLKNVFLFLKRITELFFVIFVQDFRSVIKL
jgi:hypothetical protein